MRQPRLIYLAVAAILVVAGFALTDYIADRSRPNLGDEVIVPVGASDSGPPTSVDPVDPGFTPTVAPSTPRKPSTKPSVAPTRSPSEAVQVSPPPVRPAGDDDDDDGDDGDDDDD